jgi:hypothetical protein
MPQSCTAHSLSRLFMCGRDSAPVGKGLRVFATTFNAGSAASLDELGPVEEWIPPHGVDVYVVVRISRSCAGASVPH